MKHWKWLTLLLLVFGFALVLLLAACSQQQSSPVMLKEWTPAEQRAMAKQEKTIPEGSPVALELLDYARLRNEVRQYCQ